MSLTLNRNQKVAQICNCGCYKGKEKVLSNPNIFNEDDINKLFEQQVLNKLQAGAIVQIANDFGLPEDTPLANMSAALHQRMGITTNDDDADAGDAPWFFGQQSGVTFNSAEDEEDIRDMTLHSGISGMGIEPDGSITHPPRHVLDPKGAPNAGGYKASKGGTGGQPLVTPRKLASGADIDKGDHTGYGSASDHYDSGDGGPVEGEVDDGSGYDDAVKRRQMSMQPKTRMAQNQRATDDYVSQLWDGY